MTDWDYTLSAGQVDLAEHTGLLLAEDASLKGYLSGITVPDKNGMVGVDVYFRYPEGERRIKFPFITIDFLAINPSYDRWTSKYQLNEQSASFCDPVSGEEIRRGLYVPSTAPSVTTPENGGVVTDNYLMYTLMYQVAVHARSALHDRYLLSRFMTDIFPPRSFFIGVDADSTWRRCELLSMQPADYSESTESGNKRVFRKIYTISIDAEIPQSRVQEIGKVDRVHVDTYAASHGYTREQVSHTYDAAHEYAEPITVEPPPGP